MENRSPGRFTGAFMSLISPLQQYSDYCHAVKIYSVPWHYSLQAAIHEAALLLSRRINLDYRHTPPDKVYKVFSAFGKGCWIVGISTEFENSLNLLFGCVTASNRDIERYHCPDNVVLIIEHELNKMPVGNVTGMEMF
ncbi:hypothetical protein [Citrobacter freundii]|uniref:hypothetical protein n=1 Tax=Citrobacter freundii TaxID=546 RepID=UPI0023AF60B4|nr:hypothetical protein [Citrobacter freundii]MCS6027275.1 hypothetical protein [Klebsiella pneumoniae subsp. pneumoniae]